MMIYAIAKAVAKLRDHAQMKIVNCHMPRYEGRMWITNSAVSFEQVYVVKFDPQDQFCKVVALDSLTDICS